MEFIINNRTWKIVEKNQDELKEEMKRHYDKPEETGRYYGLTYVDTQTIFLDKDLCLETKIYTLLHELTHCYVETFFTHLDKAYSEEELADIVANSHFILREIVDSYFDRRKKVE